MRLNKVNILLCLTGLFLAGCASNEVNLSDSPYSQAAAIKGQGGSYKVGKPFRTMVLSERGLQLFGSRYRFLVRERFSREENRQRREL